MLYLLGGRAGVVITQAEAHVVDDAPRKQRRVLLDGRDPSGEVRLGNVAHVDAVEAIEERWDVFYGRATLMGSISAEFKAQTDAYLQAINLDVDGFRALLKKAHDKIRADAEAERLG